MKSALIAALGVSVGVLVGGGLPTAVLAGLVFAFLFGYFAGAIEERRGNGR
jgi:hypothetical protein